MYVSCHTDTWIVPHHLAAAAAGVARMRAAQPAAPAAEMQAALVETEQQAAARPDLGVQPPGEVSEPPVTDL